MRSLLLGVLLAFLEGIASVGSIPTTGDYTHKVKEIIDVPRGWIKHSEPLVHQRIVLKFALPQPRFSELEKHLYEVSDPEHERYGQHLTKEDVEELVAPHPDSLDAVNTWFASLGLSENELVRSPAQDWITTTVPIYKAEQMLDTVRNNTPAFYNSCPLT